MIQASICTIGDEILIGQIVDTNSAHIASALEENGIAVRRMLSISDNHDDIVGSLRKELEQSDIVITTGGLGPTKDDITKPALAELSGSKDWKRDHRQLAIVHRILRSRGLDILPNNLAQADVPERAEVIPNELGTAPIMAFRFEGGKSLYSLPGVPHEALGALPEVLKDILRHYPAAGHILHRSLMVYGMAESALSEKIAAWEASLADEHIHLAYLPNTLTGIRLRLSTAEGTREQQEERVGRKIEALKDLLGDMIYSEQDDCLENAVGRLLKASGKTVSAAESCTGGEIAHLLTTIPGSSAYFLGSVTSYAVSVKENVLGVKAETIEKYGVVSAQVAAEMAEGVRALTGSDFAVSTTGLAGPGGDEFNPEGTVWIGVASAEGTVTVRKQFRNDRKRNIERFAAAALNELRKVIEQGAKS